MAISEELSNRPMKLWNSYHLVESIKQRAFTTSTLIRLWTRPTQPNLVHLSLNFVGYFKPVAMAVNSRQSSVAFAPVKMPGHACEDLVNLFGTSR